MPADFPQVWLKRFIRNLTALNVAVWLEGIAELDASINEILPGDASEANQIHIPRANFVPDVLINNSTYPIALQAYDDDKVTIQLDKYVTKVTTLSDDQIIGASTDKIDIATKSHSYAINSKKYMKAIHAIAPASNVAGATPVLIATGAARTPGGPPTLTYDDLVNFNDAASAIPGYVPEGWRIVLCPRHWNDLLIDRKNFGDKLVNYNTGQPAPEIAGLKLYQYAGNPFYTDAGVKKAFGAVPSGSDRQASVVFWDKGIAKKTGLTKQYFNKAENDPETQTNKLNYRHYFIATPFEAKFVGAIV